jgi:putative oxygen-independent coproporphyrinogen III oxidase
MMLLRAPPLSVYVHLPWCVRKCPYCDFNSHTAPADLPQAHYVDCLIADLDLDIQWTQGALAGREVSSIFFGGGTPSLFAPEQIARIMEGIRARLSLTQDVEVTMEANPGTIEHGRFTGYRNAGVTRVSLGVQSFDDIQLHRLGRIHSGAQVFDAVAELRAANFENFNLDLMYGLPEQDIDAALADLSAAIALKPAHLSHYQLTLEPGTVFFHRPPPLPDDETLWRMQERCQSHLREFGYQQYEVSAYAQAGQQCRHNRNYWEFGDYIGIGAGGHGKITDVAKGGIWRTARMKQPREYLSSTSDLRLIERKMIPTAELPFEFMLNALRLRSGFSIAQFERSTGLSRAALTPCLDKAMRRGLLVAAMVDSTFQTTELGWRFLTDLQSLFLAEERAR